MQAISSYYSAFTVFKQQKTANNTFKWISLPERAIQKCELEKIEKIISITNSINININDCVEKESLPVVSKPSISIPRPTFLVKDVKNAVFFNGNFKIAKISQTDRSDQFSMLVTDYTENFLLS